MAMSTSLAESPSSLPLHDRKKIVQGSTTAPNEFEYLRLTIDPRWPQLFSWDRVPLEIP
jgi:hypothetical protein